MGKINDNKGYLTSNLHNFTPKKIINSNYITTQGLAFPIKANNTILYPNTGDYIFNTNKIIEIPMVQYNQGGIQINPENKGKFTNYANNKGMGVQEAAQWVMKNSKNPILRKRANFAINATNFKRQEGGMQESSEMEQQEQPRQEQGQEMQIMQMVAQALQEGASPEEIMQMLVQQGMTEEQAMQIIQQAMSQMQGQMSQGQPTNDMSQEQPMMRNGGMKYMPKFNMGSTYKKPMPFASYYSGGNYMNEYQIGGGVKYNPNGYDVINEQMFNDIQKANGNAPMNLNDYQEQMSRQLAMEDYNQMVKKAEQNKRMGQQMLPKPMYDYLMKNKKNTPQVKQYIDPNYMIKNQMYMSGGEKTMGMMNEMNMMEESNSYDKFPIPKFQMKAEKKPLKSLQRAKVPTFSQSMKFEDAFYKAKKQGAKTFLHNGQLYNTKMA